MSSKLESDVCCRLQVAPSGESYGGNRRPAESNGSLLPVYGVIHFTSPAGWLPLHRYQLRARRSVTSMGKLYLYSCISYASKHYITAWFVTKSDFNRLTQIKYMEAILSNRTRKHYCYGLKLPKSWFQLRKIHCVIYYNFRHTFVSCWNSLEHCRQTDQRTGVDVGAVLQQYFSGSQTAGLCRHMQRRQIVLHTPPRNYSANQYKQHTKLLTITSTNVNRLSKLFH